MKRTQKAQCKKKQLDQQATAKQAAQQELITGLDQFEAVQIVGKGAFGHVYKARVKATNETVAIKQIMEDESMMNRETDLLLRIGQHPNVIYLRQHFYSSVQVRLPDNKAEPVVAPSDKKYLNLVTDFMPLTLAKFNQATRDEFQLATDPARVLLVKRVMVQLFQGLAHIHKHGVAHRDIKPDNILVCRDSQTLKICDFGSAKMLHHHNEEKDFNPKGSVTYISTRYYRGPELLYGNPHYGTEIDLWSAGCVLAEMFTKPERKSQKVPEQKSYTLFRGSCNVHLLALIVTLKGVPTKHELNQIYPEYKQAPLAEVKPHQIINRLEPGVPASCVDLIEKLLSYAPLERITAEQCLKHEFFADICQVTKAPAAGVATSKTTSKATSASSHKRLRSEVSSGPGATTTTAAAQAAAQGETSGQATTVGKTTGAKRQKTKQLNQM